MRDVCQTGIVLHYNVMHVCTVNPLSCLHKLCAYWWHTAQMFGISASQNTRMLQRIHEK